MENLTKAHTQIFTPSSVHGSLLRGEIRTLTNLQNLHRSQIETVTSCRWDFSKSATLAGAVHRTGPKRNRGRFAGDGLRGSFGVPQSGRMTADQHHAREADLRGHRHVQLLGAPWDLGEVHGGRRFIGLEGLGAHRVATAIGCMDPARV